MGLTWRAVVAVLLTLTAVLFAQAAATLSLQRHGVHPELAMNLPRLVGLPVVIAVAWHIVRRCGIDPRAMFSLPSPAVRLFASAVLIGMLVRISSWAAIHAAGAFGWIGAAAESPPSAFAVSWTCPSATLLAVSATTWIVLVPLSEELVQRGIVMAKLAAYGMIPAVTGSSVVFMLYHDPAGYETAFLFGLLLGYQYWITRTLWAPLVTHAVYDSLQVVDILCLRLVWNPPEDAIPVWEAGAPALAVFCISLAAIAGIIYAQRTGAIEPRPAIAGAAAPD